MTNVEHKERIEKFADSYLMTVKEWRKDDERGLVASLGHFECVDDDEHGLMYEGEEGELLAMVVGSEEYRNVRVYLEFIPDGCDSGNEPRDLNMLEEII